MSRPALNLLLIEQALRGAQAAMARPGSAHRLLKDALTDRIIANMLDGYRYIETAVAAKENWLALGQSSSVLTLNNVVLYGASAVSDKVSSKPRQANESHFYNDPPGGVGEFVESLSMTIKATPYNLAAEAFIRALTSPQLFLEGNHRTGALIMSYLLLWEGLPPFVLTSDNYKAFFTLSENIRQHQKGTLPLLLRKHGLRGELNSLLVSAANPAYLKASVLP